MEKMAILNMYAVELGAKVLESLKGKSIAQTVTISFGVNIRGSNLLL